MMSRSACVTVVATLLFFCLARDAVVSQAAATTTTQLVSAPGNGQCVSAPSRSVQLQTVPRVAGFAFRFNGQVYRTGSDGAVDLPSVVCLQPEQALTPLTMTVRQSGGRSAQFDRWYGTSLFKRSRADGRIYAAFRQRARVRFGLVDIDGNPVPRREVGVITVKGSTGAIAKIPPGKNAAVLDASRVVRFSDSAASSIAPTLPAVPRYGLVSKDIVWSVQSVDTHGNNVVDRGSVRFEPRRSANVTLSLRFYRLDVAVHDAILRRAAGSSVTIVSPAGHSESIKLDDQGSATVGSLGRGQYILQAHGRGVAISFKQPLAMSRPQDAELTIISFLDIMIFLDAGLVVALGLLLAGRRRRDRTSSPTSGPRPQSTPESLELRQTRTLERHRSGPEVRSPA